MIVVCSTCSDSLQAATESDKLTLRCKECGATFEFSARSDLSDAIDQPVSAAADAPPTATMSLPADAPQPVKTTRHASTRERSAASTAPREQSSEPAFLEESTFADLPTHLGRFEVRKWVGEGTFAEVYLGYDPQLDREVALKVARPGTLGTPRRVERFLREARAAGNLRHPNIVPLYENGEDCGRHFLVSAFIRGRNLGAMIEKTREAGRKFDQREASLITRKLAVALAYAHAKGFVHRDLKPDNVMVDEEREPLLMDFGLAARADAGDGEEQPTRDGTAIGTPAYMGSELTERLTQDGIVIGTPAYMAPEQARGEVGVIGPAADQYALGSTLYELLAGRTPFAGPPQVQLMLHQTEEPARPSRHNPAVPRDLDAICLKCLAKDPKDRYASAADLAEDLDRFLRGEPVMARRQTLRYLAGKFVRRYRQSLAVAAGVFLLAVAGTAAAFVRIDRERQAALTERQAAIDANNKLDEQQREVLAKNSQLQEQLYSNRIARHERELTLGQDVGLASDMLNECPEPLRDWEWRYLMRQRDNSPVLVRHERGVWMVDVSPDGRRFATASVDGTARVWDIATGREVSKFTGHDLTKGIANLPHLPVTCLAFSPDGRHIASGGVRGGIKIWDAESGKEIRSYYQERVIIALAFSPDGKRIASSSTNNDHSFAVWNPETGAVVRAVPGHTSQISRLKFSLDGTRIATCAGKEVRLLDSKNFQLLGKVDHFAPVTDLAFAPDSASFATASRDGKVQVWKTESAELSQELRGHYGSAFAVTFSPDGKYIASGGYDNSVRLWDRTTGREKITLRGHSDVVASVAFSPDAGRLVSASLDGTARVWDTIPVEARSGPGLFTLTGHRDRVNCVAFSPGSRYLASGGWGGEVRLWDGMKGDAAKKHLLEGHTGAVYALSFNHDGSRLASASWDQTVRIWDTANGREVLPPLKHSAAVHGVTFSPDGRRIASACWDGRVKVWDAANGIETATYQDSLLPIPMLSVAFSPDGERLASGCANRLIYVWNMTGEKKPPKTLEGHQGFVSSVCFSPDGTRLASASWDHTVKIWDVDQYQVTVWDCFKLDRLIKIWNADPTTKRTGDMKELATLREHNDRVHNVAFSPDGTRIATAGDDKTVRIWDASTLKGIFLPYRHLAGVWSIAFSHDGKRIAAGCWSPTGWVKTWPVEPIGKAE